MQTEVSKRLLGSSETEEVREINMCDCYPLSSGKVLVRDIIHLCW